MASGSPSSPAIKIWLARNDIGPPPFKPPWWKKKSTVGHPFRAFHATYGDRITSAITAETHTHGDFRYDRFTTSKAIRTDTRKNAIVSFVIRPMPATTPKTIHSLGSLLSRFMILTRI